MKDIYIIAPYIGKIDNQLQNRFLYLSSLFSSKGHKVSLITSLYCHTTKQKHDENLHLPFNLEFFDCGTYENVSLKRFFHNFSFSLKLFFWLNKKNTPDSIVIVSFPFLSSLFTLSLLRNKFFKIVVDIQDLWPESFIMLKPRYIPKFIFDILLKPFIYLNKFIFKMFKNYCFVSNTFKDYFETQYIDTYNSHVCFIGVVPTASPGNISYPNNVCKIVYVGSLEKSYELRPFFDAVDILNIGASLRYELHVYGSGSNLQLYKSITLDSDYIFFHKPVSVFDLHTEIKNCHIAINPIIKSSEASIINKHADYSFVGLPVINTQTNKEYKTMLARYNAGLSIDMCSNQIVESVNYLLSNDTVFSNFSQGSREMFSEFNREVIYEYYYEFVTKKIV
jgi:hypothetical protein